MYPFKAATTKASPNRFLNDYVINVTRPKCILSDNGMVVRSGETNWRIRKEM